MSQERVSDLLGQARFSNAARPGDRQQTWSVVRGEGVENGGCLLYTSNVIGVIEILDKLSGETFNLKDIELLAIFARQAASAIEQAQQLEQLQGALINGLKSLVGGHEAASSPANGGDLLRLAEMLRDVSALSEPEQEACSQVLQIFQAYRRAKPALRFGGGRRF